MLQRMKSACRERDRRALEKQPPMDRHGRFFLETREVAFVFGKPIHRIRQQDSRRVFRQARKQFEVRDFNRPALGDADGTILL